MIPNVRTVFYTCLLAGPLLVSGSPAFAQVGLGPLDRTLDRTLGRPLPQIERRVRDDVETVSEDTAEVADELQDDIVTAAPDAVLEDTLGTLTGTVQGVVGTTLGAFVADVDPFGNAIEANVLVVLVNDQQLAEVHASGVDIVRSRPLPGLGLTLVTVQGSNSHNLADEALRLRTTVPGAAVDYNHLYRFQSNTGETPKPLIDTEDAGSNDRAAANDDVKPADGALRIGMIDSAVEPGHRSLRDVRIVAEDFVTHDAARPTGHGTAVASIIAANSKAQTRIFSASVFFQVPNHAPGASTESLIAALDWLASQNVHSINMSLAGPANDLLEVALDALSTQELFTVIAAVGNNGPSGEPMYPGAYPSVIGVTAVDRQQKVFRYANRGEHVDFAALGVDVKVAGGDGGWRIESGTSMASPRIAVLAAEAFRDRGATGEQLVQLLADSATDLGQQGVDPVYGHGLVTRLPAVVSRARTTLKD
ncbi:MAG: S8 family serine peptidase [Woeseia sp.]